MSRGPGFRLVPTSRLLLWPAVALLFSCAAFLVSAPGSIYTSQQKAACLSEKDVNFVRPGLIIKVTGADIAQDGTIVARNPGHRGHQPDRGLYPGRCNPVHLIHYPRSDQPDHGRGGNAGRSRRGRRGTHTVGAYGSRNLTEFDLGTQYDDDVFNFVPDGAAVKDVRDVVGTATCNKCHFSMGFHGGSCKSMEVCVLCHTPQRRGGQTVPDHRKRTVGARLLRSGVPGRCPELYEVS